MFKMSKHFSGIGNIGTVLSLICSFGTTWSINMSFGDGYFYKKRPNSNEFCIFINLKCFSWWFYIST